MSDFDWSLEDPCVPEQLAITVYPNERGDISIRQQADVYESEDSIIVVHPSNALRLVRAIIAEAGLEVEIITKTEAPVLRTKDPTAAERQRRHRDKHRDVTPTPTVTAVTPNGADRDGASQLLLTGPGGGE